METLFPGQTLPDGVEIVGEFIHGGMGSLFFARDTTIQADCLVKIAKVLGCDEEERISRWRRLEREARALIQIQHPNVIGLKTIRHVDEMPYLVFPLYTGKWGTLAQILEGNTKPSHQSIIDIFREILAGVRAIHEAGFIHQDLKPSNILVCEDQPRRAVIIDLGIARSILDDPENSQPAGCSPGTPSYIAPEIIHGEPADHRADVFSIGCMLYRCLVGVSAYPASTRLEASQVFDRGEPQIPSEIRALNHQLAQLCSDAIKINPEQRIASIALFASRLNDSEIKGIPIQKTLIKDIDTSFGNIAEEIEAAARGKTDKKQQDHVLKNKENDIKINTSRSLSWVQKSLVGSVVLIGVLSAIHDGSTKNIKEEKSALSLGEGPSKPIEAKTMGFNLEELLIENSELNPKRSGNDDDAPQERPEHLNPLGKQQSSKNKKPTQKAASEQHHQDRSFAPAHWASLDTSSYRSHRLDDANRKTNDHTWLKKISPSQTYRGILLNKLSSHSAGTRAVIEIVEPIRAGSVIAPKKSRVTGQVSHHLVGKQGCRTHVAIESLTLPRGETVSISGMATVAGVAGLPCKILGNVERRKERAIGNGLIDIASQALSGVVPQIAPVGDRLADASQEDVQELTEKDPEAVVNAHLDVDLQLDGGKS